MHICAEINNCGMDSGGRDKGKPMIRKKKKKRSAFPVLYRTSDDREVADKPSISPQPPPQIPGVKTFTSITRTQRKKYMQASKFKLL